jgi:Uma2 family endonuclease
MANNALDLGPDLPMSREEYRRWAEAQPSGRFERIEGLVVAMAPERLSHATRKALVWLALRQAVQAAGLPCEVYPDGVTVEADDNDFEPDAVLRCGDELPGDGVSVPDPLVVVEVLSPNTRQGDLTRKMVAYFRVPSVRHYLIFWADQPQVIHHRRRDEDEGIATRVLTTGEITLDPPGISITVEEIYSASPSRRGK